MDAQIAPVVTSAGTGARWAGEETPRVTRVPSYLHPKDEAMRFVRFSLKRLLLLVTLVAALLYALIIRPVAIAKQCIYEVQTSTGLKAVAEEYFGGAPLDNARVEADLDTRTWADVLKCRQNFAISVTQPVPSDDKQLIVSHHEFYATPLGINHKYVYFLMKDAK
jgi:hypothetical protein